MKLSLNFRDGELRIPACAAGAIARATKRDIRVLFALASDVALCESYEQNADRAAKELECSRSELDMAVAYWRGAGVLDEVGENESESGAVSVFLDKRSRSTSKRSGQDCTADDAELNGGAKDNGQDKFTVLRSADLPNYTTNELVGILNKRTELKALIDESQRITGKIFNTSENNIVIGLVDYLGLDIEYVITLITYCAKHGKKSLKWVEKMAYSLFDEDITDTAALAERLTHMEAAADLESEVRRLFGIGSRSLTAKEKKIIGNWAGEYRYGMEIVREAYERTVDAIGKPSLAYANTITERWYSEGVRTKEDIVKSDKEYEKSVNVGTEHTGSFDTSEFFEAALRRSAEIMKKGEEQNG